MAPFLVRTLPDCLWRRRSSQSLCGVWDLHNFCPKMNVSTKTPCPASDRFSARPDGFTMIEILTVVAIIAVLALVGFPALQRALETANNGKCKANLKTLASACLAYAADNNGYLPANGPLDNNRPQSHVTHWALYNEQMEPYGIKYPNKVSVCPDERDTKLCLNTNIWSSYAIPGPLSPGSRWSGPFSARYTKGPWPRIQQFNYPSKIILL
jgi:prepilin-type N-terminal cleavage/methylation domain-containing protein